MICYLIVDALCTAALPFASVPKRDKVLEKLHHLPPRIGTMAAAVLKGQPFKWAVVSAGKMAADFTAAIRQLPGHEGAGRRAICIDRHRVGHWPCPTRTHAAAVTATATSSGFVPSTAVPGKRPGQLPPRVLHAALTATAPLRCAETTPSDRNASPDSTQTTPRLRRDTTRTVVAITARSEQSALDFAQKHAPDAKAYGGYSSLMECSSLNGADAVYVATQPDTHAEVARPPSRPRARPPAGPPAHLFPLFANFCPTAHGSFAAT